MSAQPDSGTPAAPVPRTRRVRGGDGARRRVYDATSLLAVAVTEFNTRVTTRPA